MTDQCFSLRWEKAALHQEQGRDWSCRGSQQGLELMNLLLIKRQENMAQKSKLCPTVRVTPQKSSEKQKLQHIVGLNTVGRKVHIYIQGCASSVIALNT